MLQMAGEIGAGNRATKDERGESRAARLNAARCRRYRRRKKVLKHVAERVTDDMAMIEDYEGLIEAIKRRRQALGLRQLAMDERTGLPDGYQGKLECGMKHFGPMSLPLVLGALGLKLIVVPGDVVPPKIVSRRGRRGRRGGWRKLAKGRDKRRQT